MMKIWGRTSSINVQKVMWAVAELGLPHERIEAGGPFGGLDTADYAAMNPNRLIPVLQDGSDYVWESNTIVRYLAARYATGSLWPEDPVPALRGRSLDGLADHHPAAGDGTRFHRPHSHPA